MGWGYEGNGLAGQGMAMIATVAGPGWIVSEPGRIATGYSGGRHSQPQALAGPEKTLSQAPNQLKKCCKTGRLAGLKPVPGDGG